jgi:hypothetical protein
MNTAADFQGSARGKSADSELPSPPGVWTGHFSWPVATVWWGTVCIFFYPITALAAYSLPIRGLGAKVNGKYCQKINYIFLQQNRAVKKHLKIRKFRQNLTNYESLRLILRLSKCLFRLSKCFWTIQDCNHNSFEARRTWLQLWNKSDLRC